NPISSLRMRASSLSFIWLTCLLLSRYEPLVGVSRHPIRFISVDLPDPDGPMMATYSPRSMAIDTPRRAWISSSPITYVFHRSAVWIRAIGSLLIRENGVRGSWFGVRG